eukprot:3286-Pyramimonas_sp.AAC.1
MCIRDSSYRAPSQLLLHSYLFDDGISGDTPCPVRIALRAVYPARMPREAQWPNVRRAGVCARHPD